MATKVFFRMFHPFFAKYKLCFPPHLTSQTVLDFGRLHICVNSCAIFHSSALYSMYPERNQFIATGY
jgi:hypothetical protein